MNTLDWKDAITNPPEKSGYYLVVLNYGSDWFEQATVAYDAIRDLWNCHEGQDTDYAFPPLLVISWTDIVWPTEEQSITYWLHKNQSANE